MENPHGTTLSDWQDLAKRVWRAASSQHSSLDAAGIAFFGVWALFPALAALVSLGGMLFGRSEMLQLLLRIKRDLPESFDIVVVGQLQAIAYHSRTLSTATLILALLIALWSSMRGVRGLVTALNAIYGEEEKRTVWHRFGLVVGFTLVGGILMLIVLALILVPPWIKGGPGRPILMIGVMRWPILIAMLMLSLSALYRFGPSRSANQWHWISPGAVASAVLWIAGSLLLSYYTSQFSHLNPLLGSLGAFTLFFMWSYLTVLMVLLGAQVNAEMERNASRASPLDRPRAG